MSTLLGRMSSAVGYQPALATSRILDPQIVGEEHYNTARTVQRILRRCKDLQDIIAILGMDELSERAMFEGEVEYVEAPGMEGYFGVLANHAGLVSALTEGTLKVRHVGGKEDRWTEAGGFFEVSENKATVLADAISGGPAG